MQKKEELFEIERILDRKIIKRAVYYLVKWKGYDDKENSWEPARNLKENRDLIDSYLKARKFLQKPKKTISKIGKIKKIDQKNEKNEEKLEKIEEIEGKFTFAKAKSIKSHIFMKNINTKKPLMDYIFFEIEWENLEQPKKIIVPSYQGIKKVKENCPLLLCEYYEKFLDFK